MSGAAHERQRGITGDPGQVAERLDAFRRAGLDHIQIVLDPITPATIEWLAPAIESLDR
jgi:alkanesulfonate monooxygenase SsuD/methylene tetrahydromethanopterin reductase-like flavin-dependent oxidoreductase (luciferase family)